MPSLPREVQGWFLLTVFKCKVLLLPQSSLLSLLDLNLIYYAPLSSGCLVELWTVPQIHPGSPLTVQPLQMFFPVITPPQSPSSQSISKSAKILHLSTTQPKHPLTLLSPRPPTSRMSQTSLLNTYRILLSLQIFFKLLSY